MGIYRGPNTVKEGLIFGYDTGYGVSSNNVGTRYYPGEPTVNMYTNSDFSNGESDWTFSSWDGNISHTATTVQGPYGNTVSAVKFTVNSASSYSHFHQYNNNKYTSGNSYTQSAWVKGYGTMWGKSHWGGNTQFTMTGDWQYITYTVNATSSSSSHFPYWGGEGLTPGTVFYMTDVQTEANGHATPYVKSGFTTGSRSNTESLIDLKRTTDIDVSNISFDSSGQPIFDGTDDYIEIPYTTQLDPTSGITFEAWIYPTDLTTATYQEIYRKNNTSARHLFSFQNNGTILSFGTHTTMNGYNELDISITASNFVNRWNHVVASYSSGNKAIYVNGEPIGSTTSITGALVQGSASHYIGSTQGTSEFFEGNYACFKMYNRGLSAAEIKQNFKAYKNRFNI